MKMNLFLLSCGDWIIGRNGDNCTTFTFYQSPAFAFYFSSVGLIFSAYPSNTPSTIMIISSLVRFPLIFLSGIFVPLYKLPIWERIISYISPLTYFNDIVRFSQGLKNALPVILDFIMLVFFSLIFLILSFEFHEKSILKRIWEIMKPVRLLYRELYWPMENINLIKESEHLNSEINIMFLTPVIIKSHYRFEVFWLRDMYLLF